MGRYGKAWRNNQEFLMSLGERRGECVEGGGGGWLSENIWNVSRFDVVIKQDAKVYHIKHTRDLQVFFRCVD